MGILAGDALLNYAFETAFRAFETAPQESLKIGRALSVLGRKAGVYGMIGGQVIDVKETGHAVPKDVLDTIYELKTRSADRMCYDDWCNSRRGRRRGCTKGQKR